MTPTSPGDTLASADTISKESSPSAWSSSALWRIALSSTVMYSDPVRSMPLNRARKDPHPPDFHEAQRRLGQPLKSRRMDLDRRQFGASVDQLQKDEGSRGDGEVDHPLLWVKFGYLVLGVDNPNPHGGLHTPQGTYPAALASSELANQIWF